MVKFLNTSQHAEYALGQKMSPDAQASPMALVLQFDAAFPDTEIDLKPNLVFGRGGSQSHVDIDLTRFEGHKRGVSRRHLMLVQHGSQLYIQDMASSNGSYLNQTQLMPSKLYKLSDGDSVQLGNLKFAVRLKYTKADPDKNYATPGNTDDPRASGMATNTRI